MPALRKVIETPNGSRPISRFNCPAHLFEQIEEFADRESKETLTSAVVDLISKGLKAYWITERQVQEAKTLCKH